jgi:DNA-binding NarL/FixJ family response regulator
MTTILSIEDHALIREGLSRLITHAIPDSEVVEVSDGSEAMAEISRRSFDLVLLDISLPGRNGIEVLKEIKAFRPKLPVLVVTGHPESQYSTRALRAGAVGYLSKSGSPELFVEAVRQALAGGMFITAASAELLASRLSGTPSRPLHQELSDREYDVFIRIGGGQTVGEIAKSVNLSAKTVSTYRTRLLKKMGLRNNSEVVQYAIRNELID